MGDVAAEVLGAAARCKPTLRDVLDRVTALRTRQVELLRLALSAADPAVREDWPLIVALALEAGVPDAQIQREIGASPSTLYRWLNDGVAPREGTRRLMKDALLRLVDEAPRDRYRRCPANDAATQGGQDA
jgi:hypothetical protein